MIKEYQGFDSYPKPITDPIIVWTTSDHSGDLVWLLDRNVNCADNICGACGCRNLLFFIHVIEGRAEGMVYYGSGSTDFISPEEFFSIAEESYPDLFEWLLWRANWF